MSRVFAIVGASGVGKDTLMEAVAARMPALHLVRRVITRPSEAGGEEFEGISEQEFSRRKAAGDFLLDWQAHGLSYGIPTEIQTLIASGHPVLFNGSRRMLSEAAKLLPGLTVINVTARREVLAARLAARGRETAADIEKRLDRAELSLPDGLNVIELDNSGALDEAVTALLRILDDEKVNQ